MMIASEADDEVIVPAYSYIATAMAVLQLGAVPIFVDVTKPLPFPDASVDVVYLEEVIEHISREDGTALMAEVHRILKPGSALRLTTPCLDLHAAQFDGGSAFEKKIATIVNAVPSTLKTEKPTLTTCPGSELPRPKEASREPRASLST